MITGRARIALWLLQALCFGGMVASGAARGDSLIVWAGIAVILIDVYLIVTALRQYRRDRPVEPLVGRDRQRHRAGVR